jgi:hypothetical protein
MRNRSNLAAMWPGPTRLFDQVNLPLVGGISSSSQSAIRSSTHSLEGSRTIEPPFFSNSERVTFRSPATTKFSV